MRSSVADRKRGVEEDSPVRKFFLEQGRSVLASATRPAWRQGDPVEAIFLLEEGALLLEHQSMEGASELRWVSSPMVLGLREFLMGIEHQETPKAHGSVRIWSLPVERLPRLLADPEASLDLLKWMARSNVGPQSHRPSSRVWSVLLQMKSGSPISPDGLWVMLPDLSQAKVAEMAGVSRRTACRALRQLRLEGLVQVRGRKLLIRR